LSWIRRVPRMLLPLRMTTTTMTMTTITTTMMMTTMVTMMKQRGGKKPVKHMGLEFGKHSKTPAEVVAEHMMPQKRVRQKTTTVKKKMPEGYVSSDPSD
jgi:hypothetical protein